MVTELVDLGTFILLCVMSLMLFVLFMAIACWIFPRKSQEYRKLVTDMYVASKTRQLAQEDKLDLDKEYKTFNKWRKKDRVSRSEMDLDNSIELELKERVTEEKDK